MAYRVLVSASTDDAVACDVSSLQSAGTAYVLVEPVRFKASRRAAPQVLDLPGFSAEEKFAFNLKGDELNISIEWFEDVANLSALLETQRSMSSIGYTPDRTLCILDDSGNVIARYTGFVADFIVEGSGGEGYVRVELDFVVAKKVG